MTNKFTVFHLTILFFLLFSQSAVSSEFSSEVKHTAQKITHILDYVAVEYADVVQNGVVTNQEEYQEQQEFSQQLTALISALPKTADSAFLQERAHQIRNEIHQRGDGENIAALCNTLSLRLIEIFQVDVAPRIAPKLEGAEKLFQENCAACHGLQGYGDGPNAVGLEPAPANFHERERQQHRSIFSLFNTISLGVAGTAMPAFDKLTSQQRWQLAFFISNYFFTDVERAKGEVFFTETKSHPTIKNLQQLTQLTPSQLVSEFGDKALVELAYLRANPAELQSQTISPLQVTKDSLRTSMEAYRSGDKQAAYDLAVAAYLEGFELAETRLDSTDSEMRKHIETSMLEFRQLIKTGASEQTVQQAYDNLSDMLSSAQQKLQASNVSSTVNYLSALLILLREGIEAILILAAISAVLIKTGRRDMLRYLHFGWIAALALGGVTWYAAANFINISGASREITEGFTALIAAAMLIYVGFWLHKQTYAMQWQHFVRTKVSQSLTSGALTGMAVVAFLAVYREVFESILFFQTLWLQTDAGGHANIVSGMLTAVVLLILLAWGIFKFSVRLPLKLFFRINSIFLYLLGIVFVGKGIAALQEAGKLPVNPVNFFEIDALGIYPNVETLAGQAMLVSIAILLYIFSKLKFNREQAENKI